MDRQRDHYLVLAQAEMSAIKPATVERDGRWLVAYLDGEVPGAHRAELAAATFAALHPLVERMDMSRGAEECWKMARGAWLIGDPDGCRQWGSELEQLGLRFDPMPVAYLGAALKHLGASAKHAEDWAVAMQQVANLARSLATDVAQVGDMIVAGARHLAVIGLTYEGHNWKER